MCSTTLTAYQLISVSLSFALNCLKSVCRIADVRLALPQGAIRIHAMDEVNQNLYGAMDATSPKSWNTYSPAWISSYVTAQQTTLRIAVSHNAVEACLHLLACLAARHIARPLCTSHVATATVAPCQSQH